MIKKDVDKAKKIFSKTHSLYQARTIKDLEFKKVLGKNGEKLGRVKDFIIEGFDIVSLKVGSLFKSIYIDVSFVDSVSKSTIKLSVVPVTTNVGKKVFDADGRLLGKIKSIIKPNQKNDFTDLVVKKNIFSKKKVINKKEIKTNETNIILKTHYA